MASFILLLSMPKLPENIKRPPFVARQIPRFSIRMFLYFYFVFVRDYIIPSEGVFLKQTTRRVGAFTCYLGKRPTNM